MKTLSALFPKKIAFIQRYKLLLIAVFLSSTFTLPAQNPCTTLPSGCEDLTPDFNWGSDADCDGAIDVYADWCSSAGITFSACSTTSSDISCTSGNSPSYWATFEYNSASMLEYGEMYGFQIRPSGNQGKSVYAQVYDASGCPVGGCFSPGSGNQVEVDISGIGLTDGQTYNLRVWAASGSNANPAKLTSVSANCKLQNVYNDQYGDAAGLCTHGLGTTTISHNTTNGLTSVYAVAGTPGVDCGFADDGALGGSAVLSGGCGINGNHNDSWFKFCVKTADGTFNLNVDYINCVGSSGMQFWLFGDDGSGTNDEGLSGNDFCHVDGYIEGGDGDFNGPLICSSDGTISDQTLSASVQAGKCYYLLTDGYAGDYCDVDLTMSCSGCTMAPNVECLLDNTGPAIYGGSLADTANSMGDGQTFLLQLDEAVFCCEIDASDFTVNQNGSAFPPDNICDATGYNCGSNSCGDTTSWGQVTLCNPLPVGYDNLWQITTSGTNDLVDICQNYMGGGTATILPMELISFAGSYNKEQHVVNLTWETASEINVDYYKVERSSDAVIWHYAGNINAKGNSGQNTYAMPDPNAFYPVTYYRLTEMSKSGQERIISTIIQVDVKPQIEIIRFTPLGHNQYNLQFNSESNKKTELILYNNMGQAVMKRQIIAQKGYNELTLDFSKTGNISQGIYFLKINIGSSTEHFKVWIN